MMNTGYDAIVTDLLEQINMGRGFDELFEGIYEKLRGIVPYHRIAVALLSDSGASLRLIACRSDGPEALKIGYDDPVDGSTLQTLLCTGLPRIINDLPAYLAQKPSSRSTRLIVKEGMRSNLTLPLLAGGKPIGVVFFSSRDVGAYAQTHADLLKRLAGHIAISVERTQLIQALQERNRELIDANELQERFLERLHTEVQRQTQELKASEQRYRLLVELGRIINASLDLRQIFEHSAEEIHKLAGCDRVSLLLVSSQDHSRCGFALEFGVKRQWCEIPTQSLDDTATEWVMRHKKPRIARRLDQARPFVEDRRLFEQGYLSYVYLPLICRDEGVGVLGLATRSEGKLETWDLKLFEELGRTLASALDNATAYQRIAELKAQLERENVYLRDEIKTDHDSFHLVGTSAALKKVHRAIRQVASTDSTVLIIGETGTGKELIARAIHEASPRSRNLLVKVNCAALTPGLITSELFGHEPGAFSGALKQRIGRFELAERGSIFLDEISEIPPETQVLLLRVLQERTIERVGSNDSIPVDVRVIAATNRDLSQAIATEKFRADLFYRLNVFPILVPPLRERPEDIPVLLEHFLVLFNRRMNKHIRVPSPATLRLLASYHWPGNVRELENIVERAIIVAGGHALEIDPTWLSGPAKSEVGETAGLALIEREAIAAALARTRGKIYGADGAARALGLKPTTLYGKMRKLGIDKKPGK